MYPPEPIVGRVWLPSIKGRRLGCRRRPTTFPIHRNELRQVGLCSHSSLSGRVPVLLSELASFTHSFNLLLFEDQELDDNSFRLYRLELTEIDVANPLLPQLYVRIVFGAFCEHGRFHLVWIENEHSALSSSTRDKSALFFNEATALVESTCIPCSTIWPT